MCSKITGLVMVFVILISHNQVLSYKILGIFTHPGKSHFYVFEPLLRTLASRNHDVTVISYFGQDVNVENYTDIVLGAGNESGISKLSLKEISAGRYDQYVLPYILATIAKISCHDIFTNKDVQHILDLKTTYDVIIVELFNTECTLGMVHKLNAPFIGMTSTAPFAWYDIPMNFPSNPSFIPNNFLPFSRYMSFLERVENTCINFVHHMMYHILMAKQDNKVLQEYFGSDTPLVQDMAANISLVLVNAYFAVTAPRPMVPGYIEVAGMHITAPNKLPQHIEKWINESTHGVIYFSMGSMIKGHTFPEEKRQMFLRAFGRLPQRVLWKWETEEMPGKPDNVMLLKWMPQFDILCHPNVKAFISHGGLLGVTESVHCGVPMLLMPQFGDQFTNAKAVEANGGGVVLDFRYLTEEQIFEALSTILSADSNKKAKELSERFKDRPMPPLETAIYWVEYVARHRGAPHLRTAAVGMPLYKYLLLDVIAFLAAVLFIFTYVWYRIVKAIYRKLFSSKQKIKTN